jgi:putative endopeptidase
MKHLCFIFSASLFMAACGGEHKTNDEANLSKGVDLSYIDSTVRPQDDFFMFANGSWMKKTEIPSSESAWGVFAELKQQNTQKLRLIIDECISDKNAAKRTNKQLVGDFYLSGMDSAKIESDGINPIKPELDKINSMTDKKQIAEIIAEQHAAFHFTGFGMYVGPDEKNSSQYITSISQGGIGLPDRDYYFRPDVETEELRKKYLHYVTTLFKLIGNSSEQASKNANTVFKIEKELASASMTNVERRDPEKSYNKMSKDSLSIIAPGFDWKLFFEKTGVGSSENIVVGQPKFFKAFASLVYKLSIDDWKTYLTYNTIDDAAAALGSQFVQANFDFYSGTLRGVKKMKPRWKRVLETTDQVLGDALGKLFVEKHFSDESKKKVNEMVDNLIAAFIERIKTREWMSEETKNAAIEKLGTFMRKLGFPDNWKDYSSVTISKESYYKNLVACANYEYKRMINKLGKPIDRTEWGMTTPTINAYYNPSMNEIVFPAGIMQYPFFDITQDDALNYGAMGAVIGHELSHGFDDQGAQYDLNGNLKMWWTPKDFDKFGEKTKMIVNQFNNYVAIDTLRVNGELTLGENIADLGGLTIAYYAYMNSVKGKQNSVKDGFTPAQRYFMGWAKAWCVKYTDASLKQQVFTNPHSPGYFRVNGPMSNMQEFYDAFGIKEGDKMFVKKELRAEIW